MKKEILVFGGYEIEFPSEIKMSHKVHNGLLKSITKWSGVVDSKGTISGCGCVGCGLCEAFISEEEGCENCPVARLAEEGCRGTPYMNYEKACEDYSEEGMQTSAEQELAFLNEIHKRAVIV